MVEPSATEPYQSLYRRYRPQRFSDVLGQEHVTRALGNAVRDGKVAHAYLFSGPRGTGKTSTARILAMALNCASPVDGEPDGTCASCVSIRTGSSMDVHELDAASNRKLDEMRDLLSRVALGTSGRQKVYIVDEVHQLTPDAASALLKTLEEPPGHVVFVLATTDPQRVLPTIKSRTQHYEFRLLGSDTLAGLLADVNERAALGLPSEALDLVVRRGHGSARDALSVLDQVAAAGAVEDEASVVSDIIDGIAERDAGRVLVAVAEALNRGREPRRLAVDLVEHLRNGFLATQARSLVLLADEATNQVEAQARQLGLATIVRAMEQIGKAAVDMRDSVDQRVTLEVALVRLASPAADPSPAALLQRIERLEASLSGGKPVAEGASVTDRGQVSPRPTGAGEPARSDPPSPSRGGRGEGEAPQRPPRAPESGRPALGAHRRPPVAGPAPPPPVLQSPPPPAASPARSPRPEPIAGASLAPPAALPTRDELTEAWGDRILAGLRPGVRVYFAPGRFVAVEDAAAVFALPDQGLLTRAQRVRAEAEMALGKAFGRSVPLRLVVDDGSVPVTGVRPPDQPDDPDEYDVDALQDAGPAVVSPEQRLLQAFPGAEEVAP
ncbi:MAG: DNA polymerase III subunit gamma/tau [Actinomycetota bacterium]|nr:DNA polymerase III subunit gamma/tau [Actinomycetota bacterium]